MSCLCQEGRGSRSLESVWQILEWDWEVMWDGGDAVNGQVVCPWEARDFLSRLCRCWLGCAAGSPANCSPQVKEGQILSALLLLGFLPMPWFSPGVSLHISPCSASLLYESFGHDSTFGSWGTRTSSGLASFINAFECRETCPARKALQQQMNRCSESAWNKIHLCFSCFYTFPLHPLLLPVRDGLLD